MIDYRYKVEQCIHIPLKTEPGHIFAGTVLNFLKLIHSKVDPVPHLFTLEFLFKINLTTFDKAYF